MTQFFNDPELQRILSTFIKGRMKELAWDYEKLSFELYEQFGVVQSASNLKSKIHRGNFKGALLLLLYWILDFDDNTMQRAKAIYLRSKEDIS